MKHSIQAIRLLEKAGFRIDEDAMRDPLLCISIHAHKTAEPVNLQPHHFTPAFRSLFVGKAKGGYYCTSDIVGEYRRYRARKWNTYHNHHVRNVFGHGKTELAAVRAFLANFTATPIRYNVG